jgi:ribose transport system permease protein
MLIAISAGSVVGFINGFLVVHQKTEAFIITLGMGMLVKGVSLLLTNANPVPARSFEFMMISNGSFLGVPNIILLMLLIGGFTFWLLRFTSFGRNCYALGGDYEVAEHSGINVIRTKWVAFIITGTYAAVAGVLLSSLMNTGSAIYGDPIPLMINCGVVIGGTSFAGGTGGVVRSGIGIMVMQLLRNCMGGFGVDPYIQQMILGIVIVSIICMDCYAIKRKKEDV